MAQVSILVYFLCLVCIHVAASTTSADQDMLSSPGMANNTLLHSTANLTTAHTSSPLSTNTTDFLQTNKVDTTSNTTGSDVTPSSIVTASVGSSLSLMLNATSQGSVITTSTALPTNKSSQTVDSLNSTYTNLVTSVVGSNSSDIGTGSNTTSSVVESTTLIHSSDIPSSSLPMSTTANTSVTDARNSTATNSSVTDAGESTTTNSSVTDGEESTTTNSSVTTTEESTTTNSSVTDRGESTTTSSSVTDVGNSTTTNSSVTTTEESTTTNSTVTDTGESTTTSSSVTVPDPCVPQPCENNGMCRANGTGYTCSCGSGWTGFNCSTDVDECAESLSNCNNQTSTCENNDGGYSCVCNKGYMKDTKTDNCVDIDECALGMSGCDSGKGEMCSNTDGSFQCLCDEARDYVKRDDLCIRNIKERYEFKVWDDAVYKAEYDDPNSQEYKNFVKDITKNATEMLNSTNTGTIDSLKVVSLRNGSVIATITFERSSAITLNTSSLPNAIDLPLSPSELCASHKCDPRSTTCEGVPAAKYYICKCKDNFESIPNDIRRCKATDECVEPGKQCSAGKQCVEEYGILICRDSLLDSCNSRVCGNHGKCSTFRNGSVACSCTEGYSGTRCDIKIVKKSERDDLEKILIGVGVGLGTLAFFCAIALIITCCGDRGKGFNSSYSPVKKTSMQYFNDDVTIDNWEPSLPRPKIKPGAFDSTYGDGIEMREKRGNTDGDKDGRLGATGRENPAFIPEADYDIGNGRNGRLVANGKPETGDYVYF